MLKIGRRDIAKKFERQVDVLRTHPSHRCANLIFKLLNDFDQFCVVFALAGELR